MKMPAYVLVLLFLPFWSCDLLGQNLDKKTNECNCNVAFTDMIHKLERNYIGLKQMQISGEDAAYEDRKEEFEQKSVHILPENCTEFLNDFLTYFGDGHLSTFERPKHSEADLLEYKKRIKETKLTKDRLEQMLLAQKETATKEEQNAIIGNWTDGQSVFTILEIERNYHAYIVESTKEGVEAGELKALFKPKQKGFAGTYYSYRHSPIFIRGNVYKDGQLLVAGHIIWKKVKPTFSLSSTETNNLKLPTLQQMHGNTILVSIPSFIIDYQVFKDFIQENEKLIKNSTNLVIDIRGNRGGNGIYFPLIEMYATQHMDGGQGLVLASSDNLTYFERQQKYSSKVFKPVVNNIQGNFGKIVDGPLYPGKKFKTQKSKIKNVAILTDKACASAAESFIIHSKKSSSKVKTFGSPTDGMIDYTSVNSLLLKSGKQHIYFGYPTSTLHKEIPNNGYNKTGIIPDVSIEKQEKDKVGFIINYYKE